MKHILASKQGKECVVGSPGIGHVRLGFDTNRFHNGSSRFQCLRHGKGKNVQDFVIGQFEQLRKDGNRLVVIAIGPDKLTAVGVQSQKITAPIAAFLRRLVGPWTA